MLALSPEQEARARRLHDESFVFDYFPRGEPMLLSSGEEAVMESALAAGIPAGGVLNLIREQRTRELASDPGAAERQGTLWREAGVNAVTCTLGGLDSRVDDHEAVVRDVSRWLRRFQVADYLVHCCSADDLEQAFRSRRIGVLFNLQNATYLGSDLANLETLYNFGVRIIQLTYNSRNLLGDGCTERVQGGLTHFGVQVVKRMNELGIVVDVSHSGVQTTFDAIEVSNRPIAFTHTGCRAIFDHPRSKTDDQLRALAERDGYVGIYAVPFFLAGPAQPGLDVMLDHLEHAAGIVGVHRVGIGTDWGSWTADMPARLRAGVVEAFQQRGFRAEHGVQSGVALGELDSYAKWVHITRGLVARGFADQEIHGILGKNFISFLRRAGL